MAAAKELANKRLPEDVHKNAPPLYAKWWRQGRIVKGAEYFERLICDPSMARAWREIAGCSLGDRFYRDLWSEILWLLQKSRTPARKKSQTKAEFEDIATSCRHIADRIERGRLDILDMRIYELLGPAQMETFGVQNWASLDLLSQHSAISTSGADWPTTVEVLRLIAKRANKAANSVIAERRLVERETRDWPIRYFVRGLRKFLSDRLGGPQLGTTARIARLLFDREEIDSTYVRNATREDVH